MKSIELALAKQQGLAESWLDALARKAVLAMLSKLQRGKLTLQEGEITHQFGAANDELNVHAHIQVNHPSAYRYVLWGGTIGSGEGYMLNAWWSPDLVQVIRLFVANMAVIETLDSKWSFAKQWWNALRHRIRANSKRNAKGNIMAHYDIGNEFYKLFLDDTMMYSSAVFRDAAMPLVDASRHKLRLVCDQLQVQPGDHLLEIGSGWGGLAIYAAKHYGCKVTSVTLSEEQCRYANEWVAREGLTDRVTVRIQDYRDIAGQFDKLVSIEMIEAVGYEYFAEFFRKCSALLKPDGLMLVQAITISDQRYEKEKSNADFIQTYIFPGGCLPSVTVLCDHMTRDSDMTLVGLKEIGLHYAETLRHWRERFYANVDRVRAQGFDDVFIRMWEFYLCYCEGGFRERVIGTSQLLFAKPLCRALP